MTDLASLRHEHRELAALARAVCPEPPATPVQAERTRRALASLTARLLPHLAEEGRLLAGLPSGPATRLAVDAWRRESQALGESFTSMGQRWDRPGCIERDPQGFAATWDVLDGALARLLAREESDVYPHAAGAWEPHPVAAPPTTGFTSLDADHASVFALIGGLRAACGGGERSTSAGMIAELVRFADRHFSSEERLMEASAYPGLEDHRREHFHSRSMILGFRNDHLDGRVVDPTAVLAFLESWLSSHIAHTDQAMVEHLRATGHVPT